MTEANLASIAIKLDQETINKTVERIVLQEIAAKLGDPGAYFDRVVKSCVMTKVDGNGNPTTSSYNTVTLIEYTATKAVNEFAKEVVKSWMATNSDKLKKAIEKALEKNIGGMAKLMADAAARNANWGYVNISISEQNPNK